MKSNKQGSISMRRLNMWRRYVSLLVAMVLVMGNVLPAVSEGLVPSCGKAEHTHTAECYTPETKLSCGKEETEGHAHDDSCYKITTTQLCTLEETEGHKHNDSCKTITYVPGCGTEVGAEAHAHNAACYENVPAECPLEEAEGHVHTDACKGTTPELTCTDTAEGHTHADSCYTDVMVCGKTEGEGAHKHSPETCTKPESILICGTQENPGHQHTDACNVPQEEITCTLEESEGHTHGEGCTEIVKELICQEPVVEAHAHSDACNTTEKILTCTQEEHSHTAECYPVEDPKPAEEPKKPEESKPAEEPKKPEESKPAEEPNKPEESKPAEEPNKPEEPKPAEEPNKPEAAKEIDAPRDGEPVYMGGYIQHVTVENRAAGTTEWKTIADKVAHSAADLIAAATDELKITIEYKIPGASLTETTAIDYKLPLKSNEAVIQAKEEIVYALDKVTAIGKAVTGTDGTVTITFDEEYLKANDNGTEITGTYQFLANASELNFSEEGDAVVAFQKDEANPQAVAVQLNFAKEEEGNVEDTTTTPDAVSPDEGKDEEPITTPEDTTTDEDNVEDTTTTPEEVTPDEGNDEEPITTPEDTTTTPEEVTPDEEASEETTTPEETEETEAVVENLVTFEVPTGVSVTVDNVDVSTNDFTAMAKNGTIYFVVTVEDGYELDTVKVDGTKNARTVEPVTTPGEYIIEGIQTDNTVVTITATVKTVETETEAIRENVVAFEVTEGAQVLVDEADVTNSTAMAKDGTIYFTVQVDEGYELTSVVVDDGIPARTTENAGEYIIENITTDETVVTVTTAVKETEVLETESKIQGYLDEIAELLAQGEALDVTADDYEDQWYAVYDALYAVVDEATIAWEASEITDEEYAEVYYAYEAAAARMEEIYGTDPYATDVWGPPGGQGSGTGGTYQLSMSDYQPNSKVYYMVVTSEPEVYSNQNVVTNVKLNDITVVGEDSTSSSNWSGEGKTLSTYYPGLETGGTDTNKTLSITPAAGYYVTRVVVACCGGQGNQSPFVCNTWAAENAYEKEFSVSSQGTVTTDLPSSAFGHSSDSGVYFILISVAPIPSPLYVEYDYGEIITLLGDDYDATNSVFANADGWTDDSANNTYKPTNDTSDGGVQTNDTQFKYTYAVTDGMTDADKAAAVQSWRHTTNAITEEAKAEAAASGYYFAGWAYTYYNDVSVSTNAEGSYNNYTYTFSDVYGTGTVGESAALNLITDVKLVAQWKPIEMTVTKTVEDYPNSGASNTYTFQVQKLNGETWENYGEEITLTVTGNTSVTSSVISPVPAGTYRVVETGGNDDVIYNNVRYTCTTVTGEPLVVSGENASNSHVLAVNNKYSEYQEDPTDSSYIVVSKTFEGLTADQIETLKSDFAIEVKNESGTNSYELNYNNTSSVSSDQKTWTWKIEDVSIGNYTLTESGTDVDGYECNDNIPEDGTYKVSAAEFAITVGDSYTPNNNTTFTVGKDTIFIGSLTSSAGDVVITNKRLSASVKQKIIDYLATAQGAFGEPDATKIFFYSLEGRGGTFNSKAGTVTSTYNESDETFTITFNGKNVWNMVMLATADLETAASNPDISVTNTYVTGFNFTKVNENGGALAGAEFTLYSDEECTIEVSKSTSLQNTGLVEFTGVAQGVYYLKETTVPTGYVANDALYKVTISGTGKTIVEITESGEVALTEIKNIHAPIDVTVKKIDADSKVSLEGARFALTRSETAEGQYTAYPSADNNTFTSGQDGLLTIKDLPAGFYQLTEITAPDGYLLTQEVIAFQILDGLVIYEEETESSITFTNADGITFTVTNKAGQRLPNTGSTGTTSYTIGGLLTILSASFFLMYNNKKRRKEDM